MNDELLTALRYKSEGTDIDFKSEQYRFVGAGEHEKSEMLKDILAMANAWRDGVGYILLGLKDQRPHPAEVLGISGHLDDADLQQFVHGKVKPKLTFHYEEHLYEGRTVGVIAIPKQKRAFYLAHPYGKLKSNVVYVRRGSSTDEAEPPEIFAMTQADAGRADIRVDLSVLTPDNNHLPDSFVGHYLRFPDPLPDYESAADRSDPFEINFRASLWHDNRDFWREAGEYIRVKSALVEMRFVLLNRSEVQMTNAKLEVSIDPLEGQGVEMHAGTDVAEEPKTQWAMHEMRFPAGVLPSLHADRFVVDVDGPAPICKVRFGTLLPGEQGRSNDTLAVVPLAPGRLRLHFRILASELTAPLESDRILEISGEVRSLDLDGFRSFLSERAERLQDDATDI